MSSLSSLRVSARESTSSIIPGVCCSRARAMVIQMNELFDELIEDAYDFSKDIMLGINLMPFAIGFFVLFTVGTTYFTILQEGNLLNKIVNLVGILVLLYAIYLMTSKYFELKKKYSTLFNLKEKLDKLEEF